MPTEESAGANAQHVSSRPAPPNTEFQSQRDASDTAVEPSFVRPSDLLRPRAVPGPSRTPKHSQPDRPIDRDERAGLVSFYRHVPFSSTPFHTVGGAMLTCMSAESGPRFPSSA